MVWLDVLLVAVLVGAVLLWERRRSVPRGRRGAGGGPSLLEVSSILANLLGDVRAAVDRCQAAQGDELPVARRELAGVLRASMATLDEFVGDRRLSPRNLNMLWNNTQELWRIAQPWLILDFAATLPQSMSSSAAAELERRLWERTEQTIAAASNAPDDEIVAAQHRMSQLVDEVMAFSSSLVSVSMSKRQAQLWWLVVDDVVTRLAARST